MPSDRPDAGTVFETAAATGRAAMTQWSQGLAEMTRLFSELRFPTALPDTGALLAAHRRNMEALSAANRVALEGAQAVARRHMEILQQTMGEFTETMRELATAEAPSTKAARQAELLKQTYERAVGNLRDLSDLIQKSNHEAVELINHRFREAMDEVKQLLAKAEHGGPSGPAA